jgi:hypothetical protein
MKNSSDTIGNQIRDLLAYSAVPQPTAPPGAPSLDRYLDIFETVIGLTPGGSSTVQYTFTHKHYTEQHN